MDIPAFMPGSLLLMGDIDDTVPVIELKEAKNWLTSYDASNGWVCVGDDKSDKDDIAAEFATNVRAVVNHRHLKAIWMKSVIE